MLMYPVAWNHASSERKEPLHSIGPFETLSFAFFMQINGQGHRMVLLAEKLAPELTITITTVHMYIIINVRTR